MSGASNLNFNTGAIVDPTKALSNALGSASDTIGNMSKQYLENERYKQALELQKQQNQRANDLFNMQMDEANRKKQAYQATQDFGRNYNPNQANTAWAQSKLVDPVAQVAGQASVKGADPSMFFDAADRQNYIDQSTEAARKSMLDPTQTSAIAQDRQKLIQGFGSTIDRPTAEANARQAALKAGVPVENVDAVIKSLGPLGIDRIAQNKIAQDQRNKDIEHYTNLLKNMNPSGKGGTGMGASFSNMGNANALHETISSFADTSWNPFHSGSERAQEISNAITNADNITYKDPNGRMVAATMPQKIAATNLVLMMNRAGPSGKYMNLTPEEAQAAARQYIANGTVDARGNIINTDTVTNLQNKLRNLIETPATDSIDESRKLIQGMLGSGVNTGFGSSIGSGPRVNEQTGILPSPVSDSNASNPVLNPNQNYVRDITNPNVSANPLGAPRLQGTPFPSNKGRNLPNDLNEFMKNYPVENTTSSRDVQLTPPHQYTSMATNSIGRPVVTDKPITSMTFDELVPVGKQAIDNTRGDKRLRLPEGKGTSAMGAYQMTLPFIKDNLKSTFGDKWKDVPFTPDNQEKMMNNYLDKASYNKLLNDFQGLDDAVKRGDLTKSDIENMPKSRLKEVIKATESGGGLASLAWYNS